MRLASLAGDRAVLDARADVDFSYARPSDRRRERGSSVASHRATRGDSLAEFADPHHYRAYALVNFAELLQASLRHFHFGRRAEAQRILANARAALDIDSRVIDDPQLVRERELAEQILGRMAIHAM